MRRIGPENGQHPPPRQRPDTTPNPFCAAYHLKKHVRINYYATVEMEGYVLFEHLFQAKRRLGRNVVDSASISPKRTKSGPSRLAIRRVGKWNSQRQIGLYSQMAPGWECPKSRVGVSGRCLFWRRRFQSKTERAWPCRRRLNGVGGSQFRSYRVGQISEKRPTNTHIKIWPDVHRGIGEWPTP